MVIGLKQVRVSSTQSFYKKSFIVTLRAIQIENNHFWKVREQALFATANVH